MCRVCAGLVIKVEKEEMKMIIIIINMREKGRQNGHNNLNSNKTLTAPSIARRDELNSTEYLFAFLVLIANSYWLELCGADHDHLNICAQSPCQY